MPQARSKSLGPIGLIALLLAIGLIALAYFDQRGPAAPSGAAREAPDSPDSPDSSEGPAPSGARPELEELTAGRMLAPVTEPAAEPTGRAAIELAEEPEPGASLTTTEVEVFIADNPWLAEDLSQGHLRWGRVGDVDVEYDITFESRERGTVSLAGPPLVAAEFHGLTVEGLRLEVSALETLEMPGGTVYRLQTFLAAGASLVWASGASPRPPVTVAVGGRMAPPSRRAFPHGVRRGLVESRSDLALPLVLPRLARVEPVWIGAPSMIWRSFSVAPDAETVEVSLSPAAAVHVLHDPPPPGKTHYVFTTAYPKGDTDSKAFQDRSPVAFNEQPATAHEVWVTGSDDREAPPLSRIARLDLVAGEKAVVDLTESYTRANFGDLRVHLHGSPETLKLAGRRLNPRIQRKKKGGATGGSLLGGWERAGELTKVAHDAAESRSPGHLVFEALGLEPCLHRVTVAPFGTSLVHRVVQGETQDVDIDLDNLGWVELIYPDDYDNNGAFVTFITETPDPDDRVYVSLNAGPAVRQGARQPVAVGTYTADVVHYAGDSDDVPLESEPFVVQKGATATVTLTPRAPMQVNVEARDAATDEVISLDLSFWVSLSVVEEASSKSLIRSTSFQGEGDAYEGISWQLKHTDAPAKITVPKNPFWTFDQPLPAILDHESTIVLRAHAKD